MPDPGHPATDRRPLVVGLDARPALFGRTGFGRVVRESIRALRRRDDVELRLFGAAWRRARPDAESVADVVAPRLPARLQRLLAPLGFGVETLLGPLDVYHHTDLVYAPVARTPEVLTLYDVTYLAGEGWHDPRFADRVAPRVRRRAERARRIVVPAPRVRDEVVACGLAAPERIVVAPLGADHVDPVPADDDAPRRVALLARAGVPHREDDLLVLLPGTREPRKNQVALLDAFLGLPPQERRAVLLLVGPAGWGCPDLERRLDALCTARGGRGTGRDDLAVAVAGEVDEADLGAVLRGADVVAYPSLAEGFGLPVAEAMAAGRAVLTSRGTPMADYGGTAVLAVDPRDVGALRGALAELLSDAGARAALGAAARAAAAPLTWDSHASVLRRVYAESLS